MNVVVFCGPTVPAAEVREQIDAICLPPVKHGDIVRAKEANPGLRIIAIVDGLFRTVPAVRHKEILWALDQGIHVFGAASMGALRAAELCDFGMVGIGSVFSDYRSARIECDDEVAVEHGPAELGYLPLSEALVNIRATLEAARSCGVIGPETRANILTLARGLFYADRHWPDLIASCRASGADVAEVDALENWLSAGRVDIKRRDALEMVAAIRDFVATDPPPHRPQWTFQRTEVWEADYEASRSIREFSGSESGMTGISAQDLLDELRLMPTEHKRVLGHALLRALSLREARKRRGEAETEEKERVLRAWLGEQGGGFKKILDNNHLDADELEAFLGDEVLVRWVSSATDVGLHHVLGALRSNGELSPLIDRITAKHRALHDIGKEAATTQSSRVSPAALVAWFWQRTFPGRLQTMPSAALAQTLGFEDESDMTRALLREYLFREYCREQGISKGDGNLT